MCPSVTRLTVLPGGRLRVLVVMSLYLLSLSTLLALLAIVMLLYQPVFLLETKGLCGLTAPLLTAELPFGPEHVGPLLLRLTNTVVGIILCGC